MTKTRSNQEWLQELTDIGFVQDAAIAAIAVGLAATWLVKRLRSGRKGHHS